MKKRSYRKPLIATISLLATGVFAASAISFAGYIRSVSISQEVGAVGMRRDTIYLNGKPTNNSGDWASDNAGIFVYAWKLVNEERTNTNWFEAEGKNTDDNYYFHIPLAAFTHIIFVRMDCNYISDPSFDHNWNKTGDLALSEMLASKTYVLDGYGADKNTAAPGHWHVL